MSQTGTETTPSTQRALIAEDRASREVLVLARRVAAADVTVMLTGESGVGKEMFARFIHEHSARRNGPFVAINCAAIPDTMLEAMLFGHEKGAFTGAAETRPGLFERADGGTLLLDEVTEMPLGLQAKLLRVLQEREVERLGATRSRRIDVRVIATSNRDLRGAVQDGLLREDIYYRLNVFPLPIPPLRDRRLDIVPLARHLLARHAGADVPRLGVAAAEQLTCHPWPGNVRELENVVQRALILARGEEIGVDDLRLEGDAPSAPLASPSSAPPSGKASSASRTALASASLTANAAANASANLESSLRVSETEVILHALEAERGRREAAALRLGISPRTLRYKLARMREMGVAV